MDIVIQKLQPISQFLDRIQRMLSLEFLQDHPQFDHPTKPGKVSLLGSILGVIWGVHVTVLMGISILLWRYRIPEDGSVAPSSYPVRWYMAWTWCFYIVSLSTFHMLEFFVTALYNPTEASSDSFLASHSKAYTAAFLLATMEFWIRFLLFPSVPSRLTLLLGIPLVLIAQVIRSTAMKTCGESFNHFIQTSKKDNHKLVTDGIYHVLRHPSYVGFFYYSIGTQVVLHNYICTILFALAGWSFFSRRIPYEERSLIQLFGDAYLEYANRTRVGIPFISNKGLIPEEVEEENSDNNGEGFEQILHEDAVGDASEGGSGKKTN